jgi:hypothetical protein
MENFYIKKNLKYCVLYDWKNFIVFLPIIEKMIEQGMTIDTKAIDAFNFFKTHTIQHTPVEYEFQFISYAVEATKKSSDPTTLHSLKEIKENFFKLIQASEYYVVLAQEFKGKGKLILDINQQAFALYPDYQKVINQMFYMPSLGNPYESYLKMWTKVLNKQGIPLKIEENQDLATQYKEEFSYALFVEDFNGVAGYLSNKKQVTGISQAKLFQTEALAHQELGISVLKYPNAAIVKIHITFNEIIKKFGSVNTQILDKVAVVQEKEKLELGANNEKEMIQYLMAKYGENNPQLHSELEKLAQANEQKEIKKQKCNKV